VGKPSGPRPIAAEEEHRVAPVSTTHSDPRLVHVIGGETVPRSPDGQTTALTYRPPNRATVPLGTAAARSRTIRSARYAWLIFAASPVYGGFDGIGSGWSVSSADPSPDPDCALMVRRDCVCDFRPPDPSFFP